MDGQPGAVQAGRTSVDDWRSELERADVFHVMATTRHDTVVTHWALDHPVHYLFPGLPRQKWKRRSCGEGAHGRRIYWAGVNVRPRHRQGRGTG
jgi:hypothetical protein